MSLCGTSQPHLVLELVEKCLDLPGTCPILNSWMEAAFLLIFLDEVIQTAVATAKHNILSGMIAITSVSAIPHGRVRSLSLLAHPEDGTKVIGPVAHVNDAVEVGLVLLQERIEFVTYTTRKHHPVSSGSNVGADDGRPAHYVGIARPHTHTLTFAHVRAAAHLASVLRAGGIYSAAQLKEAGRIPFRRVGDDLVEEIVKPLRLCVGSKGRE